MRNKVNTAIRAHNAELFKTFLKKNGISVSIGLYEHVDDRFYFGKFICYTYSEADAPALSYLILKYGTIEDAYDYYKSNWSREELARIEKGKK